MSNEQILLVIFMFFNYFVGWLLTSDYKDGRILCTEDRIYVFLCTFFGLIGFGLFLVGYILICILKSLWKSSYTRFKLIFGGING